jgi:hypothetical protein
MLAARAETGLPPAICPGTTAHVLWINVPLFFLFSWGGFRSLLDCCGCPTGLPRNAVLDKCGFPTT